MSEGTEAPPLAPVAEVAAESPSEAAVAPAPSPAAPIPAAEQESLLVGGYGAHFIALARRWIEHPARAGDSRDPNPKIRFGITRAMLGDYLARKSPATADELAGLTEETAYKILHDRVWAPICGDKLPEAVSSMLFDVAVRRGVEVAAKLLQNGVSKTTAVALKVDGRVGKQTLTAIDALRQAGEEVALAERIISTRGTFAFRLGDGKLFGHDVDFASAFVGAGKAIALAAKLKTGGLL